MPTDLSPHNPRIGRLRELQQPKGRREQGRFIFEGPTLLDEARASGLVPEEIVATRAAYDASAALQALDADGVPVFLVEERLFARLSDVETPTGILAVAPIPATTVEAILARPGAVLLLAGVSDPGNAGTLLRSADAFAAAGVLFGRGGVDPTSPKVVRAAMGSFFRMPFAIVEPEAILAAAAQAGRPIVAADLEGEELGIAPLPQNAIVAVGNERHGVRPWLSQIDRAVRIPQPGGAESLNAAVAGSILLYELQRGGSQR